MLSLSFILVMVEEGGGSIYSSLLLEVRREWKRWKKKVCPVSKQLLEKKEDCSLDGGKGRE